MPSNPSEPPTEALRINRALNTLRATPPMYRDRHIQRLTRAFGAAFVHRLLRAEADAAKPAGGQRGFQ